MSRCTLALGVIAVLAGCGGRAVAPGGDAGESVKKKTPSKDQAVPVQPPPPPTDLWLPPPVIDLASPPPPPHATEPVTCVFSGSTTLQKCYSGNYYCQGTTACTVQVNGLPGTPMTWNSSCGGYAYTTVDGIAETAVFQCAPRTDAEIVTCVFKGSSTAQECYSGSYGSFGCKGVTSCTVKVQAAPGTQITWKSSCGGYAYTTVDGVDESAEFFCAP